jgi:MFS transporter, DHA2 family, multidrug resistance protein
MTVAQAAGPPAEGPINRRLITWSLMLAAILQTLDTTIANVAIPKMQGSLSASHEQMTWVLTSYIVATAIMTPLAGWLAGRYGRRRLILWSIASFTLTSMLCGIAQSLPEMVIFRIAQGIAGAALVPISQAIMLDIYPPEQHGRAMSAWGTGILLGPMLGPILGGFLTDNYSWRWVFYINAPLGILAFIGVWTSLPRNQMQRSRFDFLGFGLLALAIGALQLTLDRGPSAGWLRSTEIWIEATIAGLALYLFVVHSVTAREPFFRAGLFKDRNFLSGNVFIFIVGLVMFATLSLLPALLQNLLHHTVYQAGLLTAPRSIGMIAAMTVSGYLVGRIDTRPLIALGFALIALSLWQMTRFNLQMDGSLVFWSGILQGLGSGFITVPMSALAFASLPESLRNDGSAFYSLMRNIGSSIGISLAATLLMNNTQVVRSTLVESVSPYNLAARDPQLAQALASSEGAAMLSAEITRQASMVAYLDNFQFMFWLTVLVIPLLLLVRESRRKIDLPEVAVE